MQWCVNAYCQSHSPYLMILTLSGKTGKGNLLSSPVNNYAYAVQRLNVTIISPWVYLETNLMCIEICWFFFLIIILMGSEWGFLIREKSCSILKSYRSTFESQVVLKKKNKTNQKWVSGVHFHVFVKTAIKFFHTLWKGDGWTGIRKKLSFHIIAP